jgi:hypothetical protein
MSNSRIPTQTPKSIILEEPIIPISHVENILICNGSDTLLEAINDNGDRGHMLRLFSAILWAITYRDEARQYNGRVSQTTNSEAKEVYFDGINALYKL